MLRFIRLRLTRLHARRYRPGDRVKWHNGEMRGTVVWASAAILDGYRWMHVDTGGDYLCRVPQSLSTPTLR